VAGPDSEEGRRVFHRSLKERFEEDGFHRDMFRTSFDAFTGLRESLDQWRADSLLVLRPGEGCERVRYPEGRSARLLVLPLPERAAQTAARAGEAPVKTF